MKPVIEHFKPLAVAAMIAAAGITGASDNAKAQGLFGGFLSDSPASRYMVKLETNERPGTIIVSIGDRRLYKVLGGGTAISYPIAIPEGKAFWSGVEIVSRKAVNPRWTPTVSMRRENPALPAYVPGGDPRNPLGVRALYLGNTLYRIHGTDAPWLIGRSVSRGCIRMFNEDVIDLYNRTSVGAKVVVTGKPFNATATYAQNSGDGRDVFAAN